MSMARAAMTEIRHGPAGRDDNVSRAAGTAAPEVSL
jgi:hypothetical protein